MRIRIFTEPQQGATYEQVLAAARAAEEGGFDAFFRSDHYLHMGVPSGWPGPTDAWITLAGLARDTTSIRLGTLMSSSTFRLPGPLAITVAQVDAMSRGRVELGLGTGWFEDEHVAYGIPFPALRERFDRFEEQLAIITGLWGTPEGESFSFEGEYFTLRDSPALPKPVQTPRPPIILGGAGAQRTPRLAALYADEFNFPFATPEATSTGFTRAAAACERVGRDPDGLQRSATIVVCCGSDESEVTSRATAVHRDVTVLREEGAAGSPAEVAERIRAYGDAGAQIVYLQVLDLNDLDHVRLIADEVLPLLP